MWKVNTQEKDAGEGYVEEEYVEEEYIYLKNKIEKKYHNREKYHNSLDSIYVYYLAERNLFRKLSGLLERQMQPTRKQSGNILRHLRSQ